MLYEDTYMENKTLSKWKERIREIPFVDAHSHIMPQGIGDYGVHNPPFRGASRLAGLFTGCGSILSLYSAGMTREEEKGINSGEYTKEQCKDTILKYIPRVEMMQPIVCCLRGLSLLAGEPVEVSAETWDSLESLMVGDDYDRLLGAMKRDNIEKSVLNFWPDWGASYYGRYWEELPEEKRQKDRQAFVTVPTFDYHALLPFSAPVREYARILGEDAETFAGYERLLHKLADYFINTCDARAFKISECYFRRLDYHKTDRAVAEKCFKEKRTAEDDLILGNFVAWITFEEAQRHRVPVQIHTGERWGDTAVADVNPIYLLDAIRSFPDVTFELLHGGYPFFAETGILAQNCHNITLNLSYMSMRSLSQLEEWLEVYNNLIPNDRILLGADVFDIDCMTGCVDLIRDSCARVATRLEEQGVATDAVIERMLHNICHKNAERYYRFGNEAVE